MLLLLLLLSLSLSYFLTWFAYAFVSCALPSPLLLFLLHQQFCLLCGAFISTQAS
jgi:hypothetical protein